MQIAPKSMRCARIMMDLAMNGDQDPVSVRDLADRQKMGISAKSIEQYLIILKCAGLVRGVRGAKGGYCLAKPADQITLYEIVLAMEGPIQVPNVQAWEGLGQAVADYLKARTLAGLVASMEGGTADNLVA